MFLVSAVLKQLAPSYLQILRILDACDYCSYEIIGNDMSHNTVFLFRVINLKFREQMIKKPNLFLKIYFLQFPLCMYFILLLATFPAGQNSSLSRSCKCIAVLFLVRFIFFPVLHLTPLFFFNLFLG